MIRHLLLLALLPVLTLPLAEAGSLPNRARISYQARLAGLPVGEAIQHWQLDGQDNYQLDTEINPIFGPRIRYRSHGTLVDGGLRPADYAEFRNGSDAPRQQARFDWPARQVSYGAPDNPQLGKLDLGAQDLNALPFQLAWLGSKATIKLQIITGRKLRQDQFSQITPSSVSLMGKTIQARVWRAGEGEDGTEFWLAPELGNLPVKIIRHDDKGELQLVAKSIEYSSD